MFCEWGTIVNEQIISAQSHFAWTTAHEPGRANAHTASLAEEILPFTVRLVRGQEDLNKAVQIRHSAYARHVPVFAQTLSQPESTDAQDGVVVLLAESKLDGSPLGTMRIQTNRFNPLCLEQSVKLPGWLSGRPLAEATRLGVTDGKSGRLVKTVLFKAFFQYCQQTGIEWMVITARSPIDRQYERMLFEDVYPGMGYVPLAHVGNMPHRIMSFEVETAQARWERAMHPLLGFMCHTHHPDLDLGLDHFAMPEFSFARPSLEASARM
jgi:hypothetical protein